MTYDEAIRVIEAKLYAYGLSRLEYPAAAISGAYEAWTPPSGQQQSVQERWISRHGQALTDAMVIGQVLRRMTERDRQLVAMRYVERRRWADIGRRLGLRGSGVYAARDRVLGIFYGAFRLWEA